MNDEYKIQDWEKERNYLNIFPVKPNRCTNLQKYNTSYILTILKKTKTICKRNIVFWLSLMQFQYNIQII